MGKITKHGGLSRAEVRVFDPPRTMADVLRERGKLGPYDGSRRRAKVEDFTPAPAVNADTGEATPAGQPLPEAPAEAPTPKKTARKAATRPAKKAAKPKEG